MSNIKVYIDYQNYSGMANIYIVSEGEHERYIAKPVELIFEPLSEGTAPVPTLVLGQHYVKPFFQAFADACHKQGIKPQGAPVLENELTAVKHHLGDMRRLVFSALNIKEEA